MLVALCRAAPSQPVNLIVDSQLLKQTFEEWLPKRKKKGTVHELKNLDLILIGDFLVQHLQTRCTLTFHHIRSHKPCPPSDPPLAPEEKWTLMKWLMNNEADVLAGEGQQASSLEVNPPFWFPHR